MSELSILIIRHAEKPGGNWPGPGLTVDGEQNKKSLVMRGWQRAGAWAALFSGGRGGSEYPPPTAIYAANPDRDDDADPKKQTAAGKSQPPSRRPYETILPLAQRLDLVVKLNFTQGEEQGLAEQLLAERGVVLVSWEHKAIIENLLPALLGAQEVPGVPKSWDPDRFDVVLRLDRAAAGAPWQFRQFFPRLMSGDSDTPLS
ncbi:MAG TPA: histidine phosphatase family protein [Methylocystis sp.]|nr:histidine phosphatase family protein [Methylocystis sp.]